MRATYTQLLNESSLVRRIPDKIEGVSLLPRARRLRMLAAMLDLLHLVRLLRGALISLHDTTSESDRDRIARQLIADLQAHLEHAHVSA